MPRVRKMVFSMWYFEESPADEVAASLNITIHAVYRQAKQAVGKLRALLSNNRAPITELGIIALIALHSVA